MSSPRLGVAVLVKSGHPAGSGDLLLLGQRGKEPNYGKWVIPGGKVERGESLACTAHREILEETGLQIRLLDESPIVREVLGVNEHRVILFYQGVPTGDGLLKASSDLLAVKYFTKEEISKLDLSPVVVPVLKELGWLPRKGKYEIDGKNFSNLEGFYDEIGHVLALPDWWGRNLDALNDVMAGGCSTPEEGFVLVWKNAHVSRDRLGYPETIRQLERRLERCSLGSRVPVARRLAAAMQRKGPIVFNWLIELIWEHSPKIELTLDYTESD